MILHYGIVGTAQIAPRFIQAVQSYGDEVIAVASRTLPKAQQMQNDFHLCKAYGSYQELYADTEIDIVYIATPNHTHYSEAKNALRHGKHVIMEKPFTLTSEEALSLFQYAQEQHCFLMEAQKSVFLPATIRLKELIETRMLGKLQKIHMCSSFPNQYDDQHWMLKPYGGVLYGSASYTLEYLMFILNDPKIEAQVMGQHAKQGALIDSVMTLKINDDIFVDSSITMRTKTHNHAIFYFDDGYVEVPEYWKARTLKRVLYNGTEIEESFPIDFEMIYEVKHIHDCIDQNELRSPIMSAERTIVCTQIVEELMEAVKSN